MLACDRLHMGQRQFGNRLSQQYRLTEPEHRVARSLAALFHPTLYPGVGRHLRITQQELGYLVGLSRQRVNRALNVLEEQAVIRVEYGGVRVLELERLRGFGR